MLTHRRQSLLNPLYEVEQKLVEFVVLIDKQRMAGSLENTGNGVRNELVQFFGVTSELGNHGVE